MTKEWLYQNQNDSECRDIPMNSILNRLLRIPMHTIDHAASRENSFIVGAIPLYVTNHCLVQDTCVAPMFRDDLCALRIDSILNVHCSLAWPLMGDARCVIAWVEED